MKFDKLVFALLLTAVELADAAGDNYAKHPCTRECDGQPMVCNYDLMIETYSTMSKACHNFLDSGQNLTSLPTDCVIGDGISRRIYVVNRILPSPEIRVCQGDTIIAKIINEMTDGEGTSIHWHGIHMDGQVYFDGVAMVTQWPILPYNNAFEYKFIAEQTGTHFYHAHVGMQRGEGIAGALVIRPNTPLAGVQDLPEHTLVIQDWFNRSAADKGFVHLHDSGTNWPDSIIVNGVASQVKNGPSIPYRIFTVDQRKTYRFRIISNAVMNCPIEVSISGHNITVIATDGADIKPKQAKVLVVSGGERWDFLLETIEAQDNYWVKFRGIVDCSKDELQTLAVLHYNGAADVNTWLGSSQKPPYSDRIDEMTVNPFMGDLAENPTLSRENSIYLTDLEPVDSPPEWLEGDVDVKVYLEIALTQVDNKFYNKPNTPYACTSGRYPEDPAKDGLRAGCTLLAQIDHIHGMLPSSSLADRFNDINPDLFCEVGSKQGDSCDTQLCHCIHYMKVKPNQLVELVLVDVGRFFNNSNHPMHIHGQYFELVALGQSKSLITNKAEVIQLDETGEIKRNFTHSIKKDNIMMPVGGWAVVRFQAKNLGPWLFHCHNELHVEQGMFMVILVGEPDEWPKNPNVVAPVKEKEEPPIKAAQKRTCGPFSLDMCEGGAIAAIILGVVLFIAVVIIAIMLVKLCRS